MLAPLMPPHLPQVTRGILFFGDYASTVTLVERGRKDRQEKDDFGQF
jgi:hypothetical protein